MENTTRRPISTSSVEREIPVFHAQNMHGTLAHEIGKKSQRRLRRWLIASPIEQKKWIKSMAIQNMPMLEELEKNLIALIKEINAVKEDIISEDEIEAFFDGVSKEQALRNIAASNASINEDDREWARQVLRKQET
ncbi:MAG: hypothetical protein K2N12_08815 [Helicobacter sp.]|nr:hypothetical protein [Helicobacter sp.]